MCRSQNPRSAMALRPKGLAAEAMGAGAMGGKQAKEEPGMWSMESWRKMVDTSLTGEEFEEVLMAAGCEEFANPQSLDTCLGDLSEDAFISEIDQCIASSGMAAATTPTGALPFLKMESADNFELAAACAEEVDTPSTVECQEDSSTEDVMQQPAQRSGSSSSDDEAMEAIEVQADCGSKASKGKRGVGPAISKWKKRDVAKHLAGERSRRAKRMGKVHTLKEMLPSLGNKPTVNQILTAAIDAIKSKMAEQGSQPKKSLKTQHHDCFFSELMRSTPTVATVALDKNMCIVEASESLCDMIHWRSGEQAMCGQHLSAVMRPDDCMAIGQISETIRNYHNLPKEAGSARVRAMFNSFAPLDGFDSAAYGFGSGFSFATGYLPPCEVLVSVSNGYTVLTVA